MELALASKLLFADVKSLDLLLGMCPDGHLHIFGFPHQLNGKIDTVSMVMITTRNCAYCDQEVTRTDKLMWAHSSESFAQGSGI